MSDLKEKFLSVKEYNLKDYKEEKVKEEIIEILDFTPGQAFEMEKKGFFFMPNKITYIRKTEKNIEDLLNNLTKNRKKKIRKAINKNEDLELVKERPLTKDSFKEWFKIYVKNLENKEHANPLTTEDWWKLGLDDCAKVGIFFKKNNEIVSGIVAKSKGGGGFPKNLSISFSATKEEFKDTGVYDYLNILIIQFAKELGYDYITRGKDTNLYGKHLSSGIPIFKVSLGYEIKPVKDKPNILIKFNNLDGFEDKIFFVSYSRNSDKLIGNLILKNDSEDVNNYRFEFLEKLRIFRYRNSRIELVDNI